MSEELSTQIIEWCRHEPDLLQWVHDVSQVAVVLHGDEFRTENLRRLYLSRWQALTGSEWEVRT